MKKRLQNKVVESKLALPVTFLYAIVIWVICGLIREQWWVQFGAFCLTTFFMMLLNNTNYLIRVYSRMVSCSFIALMCCACFLFPSIHNGIIQVCFLGFLLFLFMTYQDKQAAGFSYYAYFMLGLASFAFVQILYFVPLLWLLTAMQLQSLSWRTWGASLLGLMTPYWLGSGLLIWTNKLHLLIDHFTSLAKIKLPTIETTLSDKQTIILILLMCLTVIGTVHYFRQNHLDKIRVRLIYAFFIWMEIATLFMIFLWPQYHEYLMGIAIILNAPIIAHFLALTSTKFTNVVFLTIIAVMLIITAYNIWNF